MLKKFWLVVAAMVPVLVAILLTKAELIGVLRVLMLMVAMMLTFFIVIQRSNSVVPFMANNTIRQTGEVKKDALRDATAWMAAAFFALAIVQAMIG